MAKKMTRKGLAVGVAAAFVASGLGSLPATADETLGLVPSAGSGYTTLSDSTFTLATSMPASTTAAAAATVSYRITNDSLEDMDIDMQSAGVQGGNIIAKAYGTTTTTANGASSSTNLSGIGDGTGEGDFVVSPLDLTATADSSSNRNGAVGQSNTLTLTNATAGEEFSVTVTAFLDVNGNKTLDAGEPYSPTRTVTFDQASDQTGAVTMVTPQQNDGILTARVTFSNSDLNVRQIDNGDVLVKFGTVASDGNFTDIPSYSDGSNIANPDGTQTITISATNVVASNTSGNDVVWNSTLGVYEAVFNPFYIGNLDAGEVPGGSNELSAGNGAKYGAKLFLDNDDSGTTATSDTKEGSTATATVGATADSYSVKWDLTNSSNAVNTTVGYEDDSNGSFAATGYNDDQALSATVRATATAASNATFNVFVGTDVTAPVGIKAVPVTVTFSNGNGITVSDSVTVDGLSVHSLQSRVITKTTPTSGIVSFDIVGGTADDLDRLNAAIVVNGTAPGASSGNDSVNAEIGWKTANSGIYASNNLSGNAGISIASGDTTSVTYDVVDQFGAAPADGLYRVVVRDKASTNAERTTAADFAVSVPVVGGKATATFTDDGVGTGSYTLEAGWATTDGSITTGDNDSVDLAVKVVADATPATITIDALEADHYGSEQLEDANGDGDYSDSGDTDNRSELVLETESIYTYITNTADSGATAPDLTSGLEVTIEGTVTNAAGTAVPYAEVTLAANKFLFVTNSNYVMNEITTYADADGDFSVNVYSQSSGLNTLTITSGAASATQQLTYAGATSGAADDFTVTMAGASEPGKTVDVTVAVTDANGNDVEGASMTLSSTGPGYLINTSGTTLSDGAFTTKLLLGANDSGTAVVKVAITIDGEEVIKTASVVVGEGAVAAADKKVNAGSFKGYVAVYAKGYAGQRLSAKIGNDWVIVPSLASNFERVVDFTGAGVDIAVRIYIDRVLIDTINLTTK